MVDLRNKGAAFYNSAFVKMFQVPTLPLGAAVAWPWRRGSVPEIIDLVTGFIVEKGVRTP